ncbi:MAG: sigma-70 family RNA polymerase sigma factor [Candidatus Sulfotelmatobacter sp.]
MPFSFDSVLRLPLSGAAECDRASIPSAIEDEVIELFDELRDRLLRYLLYLGLSAHDGEDVIQESFLLLFQHLQRGKLRENLRGWVFRVGHNLALKRRTANNRALQNLLEFDSEVSNQCRDRSPNPEEQLAASQRQRHLLAVVSALPERDRQCLYLRAEGLRYREIAQALGISLGSVAASMARSMARLGRADGG